MTAAELLAVLNEWLTPALSYSVYKGDGFNITTGGLLRVVIITVAAWWVAHFAERGLKRVTNYRRIMNPASAYALTRVLHYLILLVGVVIALSSLGIDLTKFALFASALGVGVGFGLQTIISNFVAGLMLLFDRTLKVGDFVELESGVTGEVQEIKIRSTVITTTDNIDVIVPNAEFINGRVTNWTMRDTFRRIRVQFGVAYGADKVVVRDAVLEAAKTVPHTLQIAGREAQVWLVEFGDSSLNFELAVWLTPMAVKQPARVQADYLWAIHTALEQADVEIPFPQRDLHIRSWNAEQGPGSDDAS